MTWFRIGALLCFLAVGLGAFGAHALRATLEANHTREVWNTAVLYQFLHGLALLVLGSQHPSRVVYFLFGIGVALFSGSLYLLAIFPLKWIGPVTPLGGLCLLAGWFWLVWSAR